MQKLVELYRGKAKMVYTTEDPDLLILTFRKDTSALDSQRIEQFERNGMILDEQDPQEALNAAQVIVYSSADKGVPDSLPRGNLPAAL